MARLRVKLVTHPGGGGSSRLPRFVVLSLVAHVAGAGLWAWLPSLGERPVMPRAPIVDLVTAAPAAAEAGPAAGAGPEPAAAEPEPERPPPPPPEPDPLPKVIERDPPRLPERRPEPEPEPRPPARAPAQPSTPPVDRQAPVPGRSPGDGEAGDAGASVSAPELGAPELAWYRSALTGALYRRWRRPMVDGLRRPLEVRVTFVIRRDGSVADVAIEDSSGLPSLDRSAQRAVRDAAPFPPLPRSWREPDLPASVLFRLSPDLEG